MPIDQSVTFGPGQTTSEEVRVVIPDDDVAEATQTFMIELYGIPTEAISGPSQVEVTIRDDFDNNQGSNNAFHWFILRHPTKYSRGKNMCSTILIKIFAMLKL